MFKFYFTYNLFWKSFIRWFFTERFLKLTRALIVASEKFHPNLQKRSKVKSFFYFELNALATFQNYETPKNNYTSKKIFF